MNRIPHNRYQTYRHHDDARRSFYRWVCKHELFGQLVIEHNGRWTDHYRRNAKYSYSGMGFSRGYPTWGASRSEARRQWEAEYEPHKERMKVRDMTAVQAGRVFDVNRIRSIDEQKKLFEHRKVRYSLPHNQSSEHEEVEDEKSDLNVSSETELSNLLAKIQALLIEARSSLSMMKFGSRRDIHITRALTEVGHLRLAVKESDL